MVYTNKKEFHLLITNRYRDNNRGLGNNDRLLQQTEMEA